MNYDKQSFIKAKQSLVTAFEEKTVIYQNRIQRFSVHTSKGQFIWKKLLNPNGLAKIILLDLIRSHFYQIFWILKKLEAVVKHIALKLSNIKKKNKKKINDFLLLTEK